MLEGPAFDLEVKGVVCGTLNVKSRSFQDDGLGGWPVWCGGLRTITYLSHFHRRKCSHCYSGVRTGRRPFATNTDPGYPVRLLRCGLRGASGRRPYPVSDWLPCTYPQALPDGFPDT